MKRITAAIAGLALAIAPAIGANVEFKNESINYKVMFKWGMVNKQAGHATLTIRNNGSQYYTQLTAASESWADHFYKVRDTLNGIIDCAKFRPIYYERIAHEGSDHKHDTVNFSYVGAQVKGKCTRQKRDKKGNMVVDEKRDLGAMGTTVDMLTSFYYMRQLPYDTWKKGHVLTINIFSGKRKELLTIKYAGVETIKYDKKKYQCHHITFIFTSDGRTRTSENMDAWITTDARRIPIKLEGKLPVGKVQCFYTGG